MRQAVVLTTIFKPGPAVKAFAALPDWRVYAVGDRKTPGDWACGKVRFISAREQRRLGFRILAHLPWNHYARKMVGYLLAIREGARFIADTDDDNAPGMNWEFPPFQGSYPLTPPDRGFLNVYRYFAHQPVWPRGFPLTRILDPAAVPRETELAVQPVRVGIWQGLVAGEPDVDAIYRLTRNQRVRFEEKPPLVLAPGTISPFNSQNTLFDRSVFPLLYLPAFVNFRFTDILRGLVAQPILWAAGRRLGFVGANAVQERNVHNLLQDFVSEIPCYLHAEAVVEIVGASVSESASIPDNLAGAYAALARHRIVKPRELRLLEAWLEDVVDKKGWGGHG